MNYVKTASQGYDLAGADRSRSLPDEAGRRRASASLVRYQYLPWTLDVQVCGGDGWPMGRLVIVIWSWMSRQRARRGFVTADDPGLAPPPGRPTMDHSGTATRPPVDPDRCPGADQAVGGREPRLGPSTIHGELAGLEYRIGASTVWFTCEGIEIVKCVVRTLRMNSITERWYRPAGASSSTGP